VTRRTLSNDLKRLHQLDWLRLTEIGYQKVHDWPDYPTALMPREVSFLTQPDLAEIAANLSEKIGDQRRFFVHTDYVVPQAGHDRVEDWQAELTELWQQTPVPPIQLRYWSAALLQRCEVVVCPVCIYYYRRGPYLCAWGQVPGGATTDWRNYRLDKIHRITPLSWQDQAVPAALRQAYQQHRLPNPEEIQIRMSEAWGFDYYQPAERLLVRFDTEWDERYIRNSLRHNTFEHISYEAARSLIQQLPVKSQSDQLLSLLAKRSPEDAYYQALYRRNDPNVRQRLRAWRPHIEVMLPWTLRQSFAQEVMKEKAFYEMR
jgi:CRISPR-associated protein (TIGR03985 family)